MTEKKLREIAPRGGGFVESSVLLLGTSTVDMGSLIEDNAELYDNCIIEASRLKDYAKVFDTARVVRSTLLQFSRVSGNALIEDSNLWGTAEVYGNTTVSLSEIGGNVVISGNAVVTACTITGNARIADDARIFNAAFGLNNEDECVIAGTAVLDFPRQQKVLPGTRVVEGVWLRPPHVIRCKHFNLTEGVNDRVLIGCLNHALKFWFEAGKSVLIKYGLPESDYDQFYDAMVEMQAFKQQHGSPRLRKRKQ